MKSILAEIRQGGTQLNDKWISYHDIPCHIVAAWMASRLAHVHQQAWLIESSEHAVAFDGKHTWDLRYGLLFKNYRYPDSDPPKPKQIWNCDVTCKFFSPQSLLKAQQLQITSTRMSSI